MHSHGHVLAVVFFTLVGLACSASPTSPRQAPEQRAPLYGLVVSEAIESAAAADEGQTVAYVSLRSGSVPDASSIRIRNATAGTAALPATPIVDGGFDPVVVPASMGDRLELAILEGTSEIRLDTATVPDRRAPAVVRISVEDRNDVAIDHRPRVIFSEPIEPISLARGVLLTIGGLPVRGEVTLVPEQAWIAEFAPAMSLEPAMLYTLTIGAEVRDAGGEALAPRRTALFGTAADFFDVDEGGRIAFVSTRNLDPELAGWGAEPDIYVIDPDGTGLVRLATGVAPAWSPDGQRIAFHTIRPEEPAEVRIIEADGTGEGTLAGNGATDPTWSPDGRRIAFVRNGSEIRVVDVDGSGEAILVSRESILSLRAADAIAEPAWSPDGRYIAFKATEVGIGDSYSRILVANADGSGLRTLDLGGVSANGPTWSPDASRLALSVGWMILSVAVDGSDRRIHAYGNGVDWTPSGTGLVYGRVRRRLDCGDWDAGESCLGRIFVVDMTTGRRRQLVPEPSSGEFSLYSDWDPVWSR